MNKKGQLIIIGIMVLIMAILIFVATLPAVSSVIQQSRGCSYLNCQGYIDSSSTAAACGGANQTYTTARQSDTLACTVLDLALPFLILGVLVGLIAKLIHGKLVEPEGSPDMGYGGY